MKHTITLAALCGIIVLLAGGTARAQDDIGYSLLKNSGFEDGLTGWDFSKGWGKMDDALRAKAVELRTDGAKSGKQYLRITNDQPKEFLALGQSLKFEPNTTYTISWWTRGKAKAVGQEQGGTRMQINGYGGPEYTTDVSYNDKEWAYHSMSIFATQGGNGGFRFWVWPAGYCDIDNLMIRKSFWRSDKLSYTPGETIKFSFGMASQKPEPVEVQYQLTTSDGKPVKADKFQGVTPLTRDVPVPAAGPGYYILKATASTPAGTLEDKLGVCVISPVGGMEAVRQLWAGAK